MSEKLFRLLKTAVVLSEQFQATLDTTPQAETTSTSTGTTTDPLVLLSDSAKTLRSQVTKLSLLAITSPFTPSAISTVVGAANDSALPSLVTAALLLTPGEYTRAFTSEARVLAKTALREFSTLVEEVLRLANRHEAGALIATQELPAADKDVITSRTGRVWDACDTVIDLVSKGVVGFVAGRVQQWHDLIKDAINELEEWDPEDDTDFDDLLGSGDEDGEDDDEDDDDKEPTQEEKNQIEALHKQKKSSLRVIKPIAQIYPAIISNRLKKKGGLTASKSQIQKLESLSSDLQSIPGHVDEAAGSLYEGSVTDSVRYLRLAKTTAERAIQLVSLPWRDENDTSNAEDKEDKFTVWSRTWMKVMADVIQDA
ncbi:uncharacterized protein TRUGW13939_01991 [Talaromyces rugulosus]|uniref:Cyclin-D1-binding protein 1-like N-terminal domain-containing protein n=1 Tax=Talaromyces rugulosus TaxID=121627 RepID=A0A7H8QMX6_TALRU|nr:uncharacterized protein TRUGW13939_01991 [Talaromyces rugulosus]QKX54901.1 hypothetical protein TRUGW13939_01991 [Talaromyces rugulosus]